LILILFDFSPLPSCFRGVVVKDESSCPRGVGFETHDVTMLDCFFSRVPVAEEGGAGSNLPVGKYLFYLCLTLQYFYGIVCVTPVL
jgi:hypothetical protein